MTSTRTTHLLVAVLALAAVSCGMAWARLAGKADVADAAARGFGESRRQLASISNSAVVGRAGSGDVSGIDRRLRDAASAAGVADKLVSIEPGEPNQVAGTDVQEMLIFLRLEPLPLRQLVTFLHGLAAGDAASRTKAIELSTPRDGAADDVWVVDVTLAYTSPVPPERLTP